mgnify:CR=1 FL=1
MRRKFLFLLAALCLVCAACETSDAPELLEPVGVQVQTTTVQRGDICDMAVYEAVTRPVTVGCGFGSSGQVDQVLVDRGDQVQAGDVLAVLNTDLLRQELAQAQDELARALEFQDLAGRRYELEKAALELEFDTRPDARAEAALLENQYQQAQEEQAELEELNRRIGELETSIENAQLLAPCSGTVLAVSIGPGSQARPGATAVYLSDDSRLEVVSEYLEDKYLDNAVGVYATIGGTRHELTYQPYDRQTYLNLRAAGAELRSTWLVDDPQEVQAGMYTLVYVVTASARDVCLLPSTAVFRDGTGYYVYQYKDGQQVRVNVTVGIETQAQVEILSGLEEGAVVYVS